MQLRRPLTPRPLSRGARAYYQILPNYRIRLLLIIKSLSVSSFFYRGVEKIVLTLSPDVPIHLMTGIFTAFPSPVLLIR